MFYCPEGAEEFSPGFQPWEPSNRAICPEGARDHATLDVSSPIVLVLETCRRVGGLRARGPLVPGVARTDDYSTIKNRERGRGRLVSSIGIDCILCGSLGDEGR
jgi:hypothetical protein